eukprot:10917232-Alexandrium_andersonii.AAC.1
MSFSQSIACRAMPPRADSMRPSSQGGVARMGKEYARERKGRITGSSYRARMLLIRVWRPESARRPPALQGLRFTCWFVQ